MALYRTGTASMDAQGVITGVGTKWREPLSLIRTGATIVFLTTPLTLAVISDIVSDTEMKAIQTDGAVVPDGNYVILLNDSLTVDGMAQDVAETLRYYQSKETEIADALEFFRDFDLQGLKDLVARIEQAAKDTEQSKIDAQAAQAGAEAAQQATNQIKQETQTIKDSAVTELTQIKDQAVTDVTAIKDQAVAETTSIKNEALDARDAAEEAQFAAEESKAGADTAKAGAETARDQAEQWAKSVNPENLLHKDQNLADVIDKALARSNLDVPAKSETFLIENNFSEIADRAAAWLNMRPIGATPLGGDPVSDYDATTKRWVENYVSGGGGVGPTMNGVQNFGVGERTIWDSRAFIPAWAVPADGQLLNRTDWPELWAHAQMHTPIDDAEWLSTPSKRGMWSSGDGSTTFRAPDLNGVQDGSIRGLYGRGDGGGFYVPGTVFENGAPDAIGRINMRDLVDSSGGHFLNVGSVAQPGMCYPPYFGTYPGVIGGFSAAPSSTATTSVTVQEFALSRANAAYGRSTLEVRGNNFAGVWIIRASGGFTAANTSWSVINEDEVEPPVDTQVLGGTVNSLYKAGGVDVSAATFYNTYGSSGGKRVSYASIEANNKKTGVSYRIHFSESGQISTSSGEFDCSVLIRSNNNIVCGKGKAFVIPASEGGDANEMRMYNWGASGSIPTGAYVNSIWGKWYNGSYQFGGIRSASTLLQRVQLNVNAGDGTGASYMFNPSGIAQATQWQSTSDIRVKSCIETIPDPLNVMKSMRGYSWYYEPWGIQGFGFMADEAEKYFPGAVTETESFDVEMPDGSVVKKVKSVDTYGIASALHHEAILELMKQVEDLKKEVAELKANK